MLDNLDSFTREVLRYMKNLTKQRRSGRIGSSQEVPWLSGRV